MNLKTAVVIPTYREAENLKRIIPKIFSILQNTYIIIVDDNSPDDTKKIIKDLSKKNKKLIFISRPKKGGRGSAVLEGFNYAFHKTDTDIFIEMDADFSHEPEELPKLIKLSKPKTIVVASRYIKGSKLVGVQLKRRILSFIANLIIKSLLSIPLIDNTNGYRAYRKDAINILLKHRFMSKGYIVLSEAAFLLYRNGYTFKEYPSVFVNRRFGESNATLGEFIHSMRNVIKIRNQKYN